MERTNEDIVAAIQNGDRDLLLVLWEQNRGLIYIKARRMMAIIRTCRRADIDIEDLMQAGFLGLTAAVEKFDPSIGNKFVTVLAMTLQTAFANETGYRTKKQRNNPLNIAMSLDAPPGNGTGYESYEDMMLADIVEDPLKHNVTEDDALELMFCEQRHNVVEKALSTLDEKQEAVLRLRYYDDKNRTQTAAEMGLSYSQTRELEASGLSKLRCNRVIRNMLEHFIDDRTDFYSRGSAKCQTSGVESIVVHREMLRDKYTKRFGEQCNRMAGARRHEYLDAFTRARESGAATNRRWFPLDCTHARDKT